MHNPLTVMLLVFVRLLIAIMHPFLWMVNFKRASKVPTITNPILKLSATTLAMKIRNGELSSEAIVEAYIQRIKEVNRLLNAVIEDRFQDALNDAKMCDAGLKNGEVTASYLETEKPLYGVPVTIKEVYGVKGLSHTAGTSPRAGVKASEDADSVKLLKDAGAIPLLVSNISHLCAGYNTTNALYGTTYNPFNTTKSPGGSSGGEAALISSGASVLGLATDLAGSVRIPAHLTGIFGHKSSAGIIPLGGLWPEVNEETSEGIIALGPMARYADDLYIAMKVLSVKSTIPLRLNEPVDIKNLNIFYSTDIKYNVSSTPTASPDIRQAIDKAVQHLSAKGACVQQWSDDLMKYLFFMMWCTLKSMKIDVDFLDARNPGKYNPKFELIKSMVGLSNFTFQACLIQMTIRSKILMNSSRVKHWISVKEELRKKIYDLLKDNEVLIIPTFPRLLMYPKQMNIVTESNRYCLIANLLSIPATHVPMGLNKDGMPIGLQVIAGPYQDRLCLAVAKELETAFGGWVPPS